MFSRQLNQIRIELSITPKAPFLIRSGRKGADPTRPDLECMRTEWGGRKSVYIPGSSLKGVMRSHAERLLLSEEVKIKPTFFKPPFDQKDRGEKVYAETSPLGRTFGTLGLKSHAAVSDHLPGAFAEPGSPERREEIEKANRVEQRSGAAIDRLLGSAATRALFDQELVVQGRFDGHIVLRNVQLYQLALILMVLRDLDEGYLQLGSGTSRGNGWVTAEVQKIVIETRLGQSRPGMLQGAAPLMKAEASVYDLFDGDELPLPPGLEPRARLIWDQLIVEQDRIADLAESLVAGPWSKFLQQARARRHQWKG